MFAANWTIRSTGYEIWMQLTINEVLDAIREMDDGDTLGIIINPFASDEPQGIDWSMGAEDAGDRADCVFLYELEEWTKDNW